MIFRKWKSDHVTSLLKLLQWLSLPLPFPLPFPLPLITVKLNPLTLAYKALSESCFFVGPHLSSPSPVLYSQPFLGFIEKPIFASGLSNLPLLLPGGFAAPRTFGRPALIQ